MNEWFQQNNLIINTKNIAYCTFQLTSYLTSEHNGERLTCVDHALFLEIVIDSNLSWNSHTDDLSESVVRLFYSLKVVSRSGTLKQARAVYHACVRSRLPHGIFFFWVVLCTSKVFILQKGCLRTVLQLQNRLL